MIREQFPGATEHWEKFEDLDCTLCAFILIHLKQKKSKEIDVNLPLSMG